MTPFERRCLLLLAACTVVALVRQVSLAMGWAR